MRGCGVPGPGAEVEMLELPEPRQPERGELLVEVEAAGVGAWDRLLFGGGWDVGLRPPAALGVEGVGRVLAAGSGVEDIQVGDRVLAHAAPLPVGSGFWAERVLIRAEHAAPCPPTLDPVQAAALPVNGLTAAQAVEWLGLGSGQRLLVTNGAGATGALALQLAAATGVRVTATASPGKGLRLRRLGVAEVLDYHDSHWPQRAGTDFDGVLAAAPGTAPAYYTELNNVVNSGGLYAIAGNNPQGTPYDVLYGA